MATLYAYSPNGTQATLPVNVMGFTQSLATNGWCKLPNGLIFQWSNRSYESIGTEVNFSYPIAFPSAIYNTQVCNVSTVNDSGGWGGCNGICAFANQLSTYKVTWYAGSDRVLIMLAIGK